MGNELRIEQTVQMRMPGARFLDPLDLKKPDSAVDGSPVVLLFSQGPEASIEAGYLEIQRIFGMLERER